VLTFAPLAALSAEPQRLVAAGAIAFAYVCFSALVLLRHAARRAAPSRQRADQAGASVLVAYASQTGTAEALAQSTSEALRQAGRAVSLQSFAQLDAAALAHVQTALFIVSTTGEGDPPDSAARFVRTAMRETAQIPALRYAVLALGDRGFARYCAFGDAVDAWLADGGATRLFETIRVHSGDAAALALWWQRIGVFAGQSLASEPPATTQLSPWSLCARTPANPRNPENAAYYVSLRPTGPLPQWTAGDIAIVRPRNDPADVAAFVSQLRLDGEMQRDGAALAEHLARSVLPQTEDAIAALSSLPPAQLVAQLQPLPTREYSIASLPDDGCIELLVRQARHPNGRLGLGSGWLTQHAPNGTAVELGVRTNAAFHPPRSEQPMILIGNGTGIAGLRAHLKARAAAGAMRNWLIFGERAAADDFFYRDDIAKWRIARVLERVDFAFSRDQPQRVYVQDCLRTRADDIRAWIDAGAVIYVCGSLRGMSAAVTEALTGTVGETTLADMIETGRYRRDVY